jgi:hypothetical protein
MQLQSVAARQVVITSESQDSGRIAVYTKPTEPRNIGGVLDDGLRLWRLSVPKTWPLAVLAQLVVAVPLLWVGYRFPALAAGARTSGALSAANAANVQLFTNLFKSPSAWLAYAVMVIFSILCYTAIVLRVADVESGCDSSLSGSLTSAIRLLPRLLLQLLAYFGVAIVVAIVLALAVGVGSSLAGGTTVATTLMFLVFFLLGTFVLGRIFLAWTALILDDAGAVESIRISWRMTRGFWWRCAAILVVLIVIGAVFSLLVGVAAAAIGAALGHGLSANISSQLISLIANAFLGSLYPAVLIAVFYDLKLRKQGADLLGRVDALARQ